jgi:hypothetical protein
LTSNDFMSNSHVVFVYLCILLLYVFIIELGSLAELLVIVWIV